jgi:hypothetical protein
MPVLRRPHDRHRDLLARLRTQASTYTGDGANQDRYVMMQPPTILDHLETRYSCQLAAGRAQARIGARHSTAAAPPVLPRYAQIARSHPRMRPGINASRSRQPPQSSLSKPEPAAKSP